MRTLRVAPGLDKSELQALATIADNEGRSLRDQVRYMVRQELIRRGLLVPERNLAPAESLAKEACDDCSS
jgi:hypothetical protein